MNYETKLCIKVAAFLLPFVVAIVRLIAILPALHSPEITAQGQSFHEVPLIAKNTNVMIFLGSGGHTGEMMRILSQVDLSEVSRTWVTSSNDSASMVKARDFEEHLSSSQPANFLTLHRARAVQEPLLLSIQNTVRSFISTYKGMRELPQLPSVLLLNGPGTSVPLAYMLFAMKYFGLCTTRVVYIESLARVNLLSLSGKLLLPITDRFIVQWEQLYYQYKRAEYYGVLI
ncbi:glycosyltransferase family 1 protein [Suhomyces tanzawaensis NRRL Y-17324]|uniref:UDP-N-acetylglucosamine transferase subunit ALG14 n=1 Tax=Suhomyces tanzawaensis NRRL Y-17324 TaxID=984487 RepID=A0A1E4SSI8_9ASCO|nr:glycosyltransferase family 1 protein [Suhomyces tanzawaensis NRRL Y-17324]ODV82461.1 glycosyltransferase family 1 protein [Suhomyces tanzawaensis NRRL Y-17324]